MCKLNGIFMEMNSKSYIIKLEELINSALEELYRRDFALIFDNVSERAITHKLAEYLQKRFPQYDVDCEYNRNYESGKGRPKYLKIISEKALKISKEIKDIDDSPDRNISISGYCCT